MRVAATNIVKDSNGGTKLDGIGGRSNSEDTQRKRDHTSKVGVLNKQHVTPSSTDYHELYHKTQHVSRQ